MKLIAYLTALLLPARSEGPGKQYEPCEHPRTSGMMGGDPDQTYSTPCKHCAEAENFTVWVVGIVLALAAIAALVVWRAV